MIFAFLSARLRRWLLLAVLLPVGGRLLEALGVRVAGRSPRASRVLRQTGGTLRNPPLGRRRRR